VQPEGSPSKKRKEESRTHCGRGALKRISNQKAQQVREHGFLVDSMVQNGLNLQVDENSLTLPNITSIIYVKQN
jgi:hypothetical protein